MKFSGHWCVYDFAACVVFVCVSVCMSVYNPRQSVLCKCSSRKYPNGRDGGVCGDVCVCTLCPRDHQQLAPRGGCSGESPCSFIAQLLRVNFADSANYGDFLLWFPLQRLKPFQPCLYSLWSYPWENVSSVASLFIYALYINKQICVYGNPFPVCV